MVHALDILGAGLQTDQNHLMAGLGPAGGVLGVEDDLAAGGAGRGGQRAGHGGGGLQGRGVELGMEQGVQLLGIHHEQGVVHGDEALIHEIAGDLQSGLGGPLAVAGLEHVELLILDGELHVLHVVIVGFQLAADVHELLVGLGDDLLELVDGLGGADAGHHVFALGVHEELAEEVLFAGGGVTGEGYAGAGIVAGVAEDHHLHVDGSAPVAGDVVHAAIVDGAGVVPGTEHGLDGAQQLLLGIGGEVRTDLGLVLGLELLGQLLEVVGVQLGVQLHALLGLHLVDEFLEVLFAHLHDHVGVHLDEPTIGVIGEAGVAGLAGEGFHHGVVEAQVQDGVHHARHGSAGAGTDGDQQRVVQVAELLAAHLLELLHVLVDLGQDLVVDPLAVIIELDAGFGGDGEALGHGHAQVGHLGQVRALAAQQVAHVLGAFGKQVYVFVCQVLFLPF